MFVYVVHQSLLKVSISLFVTVHSSFLFCLRQLKEFCFLCVHHISMRDLLCFWQFFHFQSFQLAFEQVEYSAGSIRTTILICEGVDLVLQFSFSSYLSPLRECLHFDPTSIIIKVIVISQMNSLDQHEQSAHTESRTHKSPNPRRGASRTEADLECIRLREEYGREVQNCRRQIEILKDQLYHKNQEIQHLNTKVILKLKQELNDAHKEKIKHFQETQKNRKQLEKLKNDNYSMQHELDRGLKDRKTYYSKLEDLKQVKQATKRELLENQKIIRNYSEQNRWLEKEVAQLKMDVEELQGQLREAERKIYEIDSEYKANLQKNFTMEAELRALHYKQKDQETAITSYRERVDQLERHRERLLDQIEDQESRRGERPEMDYQIVQIKSLMNQIYSTLEQKNQEKKGLSRRLQAAVGCLGRNLSQR